MYDAESAPARAGGSSAQPASSVGLVAKGFAELDGVDDSITGIGVDTQILFVSVPHRFWVCVNSE